MYKHKFMRAWSIGFIPIKSEDIADDEDEDGKLAEQSIRRGKRIKSWELLEFSACAVPSNPNALTNAIKKGIDIEPLKEEGFIEIEDEKAKYNCECINCGYKMTSDKHCKEIKCPKCGGTMRRAERPGPGEEINMNENVITKPEETENYIRIPVKGEEGKHKGHKIRWITVSAKEGIKGIYCIDCKKIITFVFDKRKGWTMEKAKKWMEEHGKTIVDIEAKELEIEIEEKGVIPYKETPKAPEDEDWDAGKEVKQAEVEDLKVMCAWFDSENPDIKASYKLPHHKAKSHAVVWRGVAAAMAALLGARGGVDIPEKDKKGVYNHLAKHYKQFDKEPPEFRDYSSDELKELFPEIEEEDKSILAVAERFCEKYLFYRKKFEDLKKEFEKLELKAGAVLNAKNKQNLKQAQQLIQEVLDSAESTREDSRENDEDNEKEIEIVEEGDNVGDTDVKGEVTDEENIEVDDKVISEIINEKMNYLLGKVKQSNTKNNKKQERM